MPDAWVIPNFIAVTCGFAVFLLGWRLNRTVAVLRAFNIPEAVSGGLVAAVGLLAVYWLTGIAIEFDMAGRDLFLVLFFAGIGLNARLADLVAGGKPLILLLLLTLTTIVAQNGIGLLGALVFDLPAKAGVLLGSAALIGGHGTAIAWAPEVETATGLQGASELGVAVATLGLVLAALIGGPIAKYLVERRDLRPSEPDATLAVGLADDDPGGAATLNHVWLMRAILTLNIVVIAGYVLHQGIDAMGLRLPLFVPCLIMGIVVSNAHAALFPAAPQMHNSRPLAVLNELSLGVFLAMSLMSMQLWSLGGLGVTLLVVLAAQTVFAVGFVIFVLFRVMGSNYLAAVLAAGFGGFALGATPTAIANMTAVTKRYGPSPIAFVVLPLVSAFFVDLANAVVIQTIVNF
ncbi:MAG: sodium/glutamate symporter [Pseudomonadota bacterium]